MGQLRIHADGTFRKKVKLFHINIYLKQYILLLLRRDFFKHGCKKKVCNIVFILKLINNNLICLVVIRSICGSTAYIFRDN